MKAAVLDRFAGLFSQRMATTKKTPADRKHATNALALALMLDYIETLPDDHELFKKLGAVSSFNEIGRFYEIPANPAVEASIGHCGERFKSVAREECAIWFEQWVNTLVGEPL